MAQRELPLHDNFLGSPPIVVTGFHLDKLWHASPVEFAVGLGGVVVAEVNVIFPGG
jgi:hypothetical protein